MGELPKLHFFCGKMAAGKSTLAKTLAEQHSAILLVEDTLLGQLYPQEVVDIPSYVKYADRLKLALEQPVIALLSQGVTVVLDFPANTSSQRQWFWQLIDLTQVDHVLHFVDKTDAVCKQQLRMRSANKPKGTAFTSDAEYDAITRYFEPPTDAEQFNIVRYTDSDE